MDSVPYIYIYIISRCKWRNEIELENVSFVSYQMVYQKGFIAGTENGDIQL